ncbi:ESPR-type extended signal peptide-containing protein, partial [Burkholderia sp. MSMB1459WGS]|uniref:ESPR-type extended signal peptide-containing protein n=1 Tax=Burkholderia sp. MSMB1459WGS TaxID=1637970 RepID=UPI0027BAA9D9
MNKIYKIIWSHVSSGWVVVSEGAKQRGKTASAKEAPPLSREFHHAVRAGRLGIVPLLLLSAFSPSVFAQIPTAISGLIQTNSFNSNSYIAAYQLIANSDNQLQGLPEGILLSGFGAGTTIRNYFYGYTDLNGLTHTIIGDSTGDTGNNSLFQVNAGRIQVGNRASAGPSSSIALGANASASANSGDVALGSGSVTGATNPTASVTIGSTTYGGFAGTNPTSVVSVGKGGSERQITNVAAGRITATSTDAINGSQLYSLASTTTSSITSLSSGLSSANSNVSSLSTGLSSTNSNVSSLSTGLSSTDSNVSSLSTGLSSTNSNVSSLSTGLSSTNSNVSSLSTGLSSTNSNVSSLSTGLSSTNSNVSSLSTGLSSTNSNVSSLSSGLSSTDSNVSSLSTGLSSTNSNVSS